MVCLSCTATGERVCLAAEGFGNRHCFLENIADKNIPPDLSQCVFVIEQALSVRALQELVTAAGSESVSLKHINNYAKCEITLQQQQQQQQQQQHHQHEKQQETHTSAKWQVVLLSVIQLV